MTQTHEGRHKFSAWQWYYEKFFFSLFLFPIGFRENICTYIKTFLVSQSLSISFSFHMHILNFVLYIYIIYIFFNSSLPFFTNAYINFKWKNNNQNVRLIFFNLSFICLHIRVFIRAKSQKKVQNIFRYLVRVIWEISVF